MIKKNLLLNKRSGILIQYTSKINWCFNLIIKCNYYKVDIIGWISIISLKINK